MNKSGAAPGQKKDKMRRWGFWLFVNCLPPKFSGSRFLVELQCNTNQKNYFYKNNYLWRDFAHPNAHINTKHLLIMVKQVLPA